MGKILIQGIAKEFENFMQFGTFVQTRSFANPLLTHMVLDNRISFPRTCELRTSIFNRLFNLLRTIPTYFLVFSSIRVEILLE